MLDSVEDRARFHAALGHPVRVAMIDALGLGDRTFSELRDLTGLTGNLLAHHLEVLEAAGLIERRRSEGDHRRKYVVLRHGLIDRLRLPSTISGTPLFVCTHNSARSQFAAALWRARTGEDVQSAGTNPAQQVHPKAVAVAADLGVDLRGAVPSGYDTISATPDLVISVCDRAREAALPISDTRLHWSIPDPVLVASKKAFHDAFVEISERIERLTAADGR
jgi:ArsR family transcriptional regulator, arsenate/arsenite/antimonite-responsive transcriptional repressor / arsenate reductase (thioredoxin)